MPGSLLSERSGVAGRGGLSTMTDAERGIEALRIAHRDLDDAIVALSAAANRDELQLARLKKQKLRLKDEIAQLEDQMIPDIIA